MESYRILNRLGKGAQGSVYLVEHRDEGTTFVLKKIECKDEGEANASFKEAMVLRDLEYPSICVYKEFFVIWDTDDSAINFCIIMDNYENGDLKRLMKAKQEAGELIREEVLKIWIGQIVGALVYINSQGVIHRDLKPSNIFVQDEANVRIGDFGVATVMKDAQCHSRSIIGTSRYIAPETLDGPFSKKSDMWSLGVILLELMKCTCTENEELDWTEKLSPEEILRRLHIEDIPETYSHELRDTVKTLLEVNVSKRPTAEELVNTNSYVRFCVDFVDCSKMDKEKRKGSSSLKKPPTSTHDLTSTMLYVESVQYDETKVPEALTSLLTLLKDDEQQHLNDSHKKILMNIMKQNLEEVTVQCLVCDILNHIVPDIDKKDFIYTKEMMCVLVLVIKTHHLDPAYMQKACALLSACAEDEVCGRAIGELQGIRYILTSLKENIEDAALTASACEALWNLAVHEKNATILTSLRGIVTVCEALRLHMANVAVVETAAATLLSLAMEEENLKNIVTLGTVGLLMEALHTHCSNAKVVKNSCFALASFSEIDEESAFNVLKGVTSEDGEISGLSIISSAYDCHKDNAEVVEAVATLFMEISVYQEIKLELQYFKIGATLLAEVHKRFKDNKDIITPCEGAMANLDISLDKCPSLTKDISSISQSR